MIPGKDILFSLSKGNSREENIEKFSDVQNMELLKQKMVNLSSKYGRIIDASSIVALFFTNNSKKERFVGVFMVDVNSNTVLLKGFIPLRPGVSVNQYFPALANYFSSGNLQFPINDRPQLTNPENMFLLNENNTLNSSADSGKDKNLSHMLNNQVEDNAHISSKKWYKSVWFWSVVGGVVTTSALSYYFLTQEDEVRKIQVKIKVPHPAYGRY